MVREVLCVRQQTSQPHVSVATVVSALALEYLSAPIGIIRNFMWRFVLKRVEQRSWLKHPANMRFEQHLHHWKTIGPRTRHKGLAKTKLSQRWYTAPRKLFLEEP